MLSRFLSQPSRAYRNFQLVFLALALNFLIPGASYIVTPETAISQFKQLGTLLGGGDYPIPEVSIVWRVLAGTNVLTLGVMCVLLMVDLRRFYAVLWPLSFMKATTALTYLTFFATVLPYPMFAAIFLFDGLTTVAFLYFAIRARRQMDTVPGGSLVPQPLSSRRPEASWLPKAAGGQP